MEWTPDLRVDGGKIDEQHKELFRRIGELVAAIKTSTCKYKIGPTTTFLEEYVVEHFTDEQAMMQDSGYPGYESHKAEHERFIRDFEDLKEKLDSEQSNYTKSVYTNQMVVDWILHHIKERDKAFGRFLSSGKNL